MGRLRARSDYERIRSSRNKAPAVSRTTISALRHHGKSATPLRRSGRLQRKCHAHDEERKNIEKPHQEKVLKTPVRRSRSLGGELESHRVASTPVAVENEETEKAKEEKEARGIFSGKSDYESLREARISDNKARMASLGIYNKAEELCAMVSSNKSVDRSYSSKKRNNIIATPLRRSERLRGVSATVVKNEADPKPIPRRFVLVRCGSTGRGKIYDSILGICCHFCRQKTLCWEEDCEHCRKGDIDKPCIGKTECSACHSSNGVLCRACLKVRYGEEMEEVRMDKNWMCPHCIEEKGINPYWICNSSFCMKKRKMVPTGIAIYQAREMGYKSVAHLIMDKLKHESGYWARWFSVPITEA